MPARLTAVLERSKSWGFLGPGPVEAHIAHADQLVATLAGSVDLGAGGRGLDLGSGGGVPGLVVALATPAWSWVLLDSMERRTAFLGDAVVELDLVDRVTVWRERAEVAGRDPGHRGRYDVVTARSFAAPAVTAECAAPLLRVGGVLVVSEPPESDPTRWPADGLAALGFDPVPEHQGSWIALRLAREAPDQAPRKVGLPAKRPLW